MRRRRVRSRAILVLLACGWTCARRPPAPGQEAFEAASGTIVLCDGQHVAFGNTGEAEALAAAFSRTFEGMRHLLFTEGREKRLSLSEGHFLTYCRREGRARRRS